MKRFTETELAVIKQWHLTPENIVEKMNNLNYAEVASWCMHNGFPTAYDKISVGCALQSIHDKFWSDDGFDSISIEDVAAWVLTTYLTEDRVMVMSGDEIIKYLQDWKYFFGFRKHEGRGEFYRQLAFQVWDGNLVQDPNNDEIWYIERDKMEDML